MSRSTWKRWQDGLQRQTREFVKSIVARRPPLYVLGEGRLINLWQPPKGIPLR
jgi:hypothetical protein